MGQGCMVHPYLDIAFLCRLQTDLGPSPLLERGDKLRQLRFEEGIDTESFFINIIRMDSII